ncbi:hypothetical protein D3C72_664630 [compost metagenome]
MIKLVAGYSAVLGILLRLKNDGDKRHSSHYRIRWPYAAVACIKSLAKQLAKRNEDTIRSPDRILIQIVDIHDIILDCLYELAGHDEVVRIPFGIFTAEFTHFPGEAFSIEVSILTQHLKIAAVDDILTQFDDLIQDVILCTERFGYKGHY